MVEGRGLAGQLTLLSEPQIKHHSPHEPSSNFLVSPLITPIVVPYIIPLKEFRL